MALQLADGHAAGAAFRGGGRTGARGSTGSVCPADARERVSERPPSGDGGGTPLGLIIGIVVGGLLLLCVLAAAIYKAKRVRVKALG